MNAHAAAPSVMTAHMYGCEMRCLNVELIIGCVFWDGVAECIERARGLEVGRAVARGHEL